MHNDLHHLLLRLEIKLVIPLLPPATACLSFSFCGESRSSCSSEMFYPTPDLYHDPGCARTAMRAYWHEISDLALDLTVDLAVDLYRNPTAP